MDFNLANQYAEQIAKGNSENYETLVDMCIPYLLSLRKKLGFYCICVNDIRKELAADSVSDALMDIKRRKLPFTVCLHNAFRNSCRKRVRIIREHDLNGIIETCEICDPRIFRQNKPFPSPPVKSQDNELVELARHLLDTDHEPFSKRVVYQKTRGSTYPEMAEIFSTTLNECKRVYWHDINDLRNKLNSDSDEQ